MHELARRLREYMEERFLWNLMCQVVMALEFCHNRVCKSGEKRPIIHRDLKPENVFLTEDNVVKVRIKLATVIYFVEEKKTKIFSSRIEHTTFDWNNKELVDSYR